MSPESWVCSGQCRPTPSSVLGTWQVLNKALLSEQLSQPGATHTAVQSCHFSPRGEGSPTLRPAWPGRIDRSCPPNVLTGQEPPWARPSLTLPGGWTQGARASSQPGHLPAMLSTRMKGRGDGSQTGRHPSCQELKVQPPAPLRRGPCVSPFSPLTQQSPWGGLREEPGLSGLPAAQKGQDRCRGPGQSCLDPCRRNSTSA